MDRRQPDPRRPRAQGTRRLIEQHGNKGSPVAPAAGDLALPKPPGGFRSWLHSHPRVVDGLVVAAYVLPSLAGLAISTIWAVLNGTTPMWELPVPYAWVAVTVAMVIATSLCVALRRTRPVLLVVVGCFLSVYPNPAPALSEGIPVLLGLYAAGAYRSSRTAWWSFAVAAFFSLCGLLLGMATPMSFSQVDDVSSVAVWSSTAAGAVVVLLIATLMGTSVGNRRRYLAALLDRAAQLARERDQEAQIATGRERSRIAREMHDVIAHSVSVMIALAEGAAAAARTKPEQAAETMSTVAETGREALGEVRRLLGVLHEEGAEAERRPQPGLDDLVELVEGFRSVGLDLDFTMTGEAPRDSSLGLTVYRVVQEALTNALRYARGARTAATIAWSEDSVHITVVDDGTGAAVESSGAGRGLVGLRERAALYAGTVEAGARPGGGWLVDVVLHTDRRTP